MSGYTYDNFNMNSGDTSPEAPNGVEIHGGALPLNMNSGDTNPEAPCGDADHVGVMTGFPDSSGDVEPKPPVIDGVMPMNLGKTTATSGTL